MLQRCCKRKVEKRPDISRQLHQTVDNVSGRYSLFVLDIDAKQEPTLMQCEKGEGWQREAAPEESGIAVGELRAANFLEMAKQIRMKTQY